MMVVIGLAMLGFILGDFNLRPSTRVAEINGKSFEVEDYLNEQKILRNFYKLNYGDNLDPQIEQNIEDEMMRFTNTLLAPLTDSVIPVVKQRNKLLK